ncbi:hypothetical protein [Pedobacter cryoconitis]|nr:hypothetical protein [Pedobacter cryoconitis]
MTVTKPQNLGVVRSSKTVVNTKRAAWLNIDDKKVSVSFVCKSPAKFWGGLGAMLVGIAVGIICIAVAVVVVAAIVGTGGVAGVILAGLAASVTGATTAIAGIVAIAGAVSIAIGEYKEKHECDCTLEGGSEWKLPHSKVTFNKKNALLQSSYLKCIKGGMIQPFLSPIVAHKAAAKFSSNNKEEVDQHLKQQAWMGFVSGLSGLGDPLGTGIGVAFAGAEYFEGNDIDTLANEGSTAEKDYQTDLDNGLFDNGVGTLAGAGKGTKEVFKDISLQNRTIISELMQQGATYDQASAFARFGEKTFKGEFSKLGAGLGVGLGVGLAGSVANHYIAKSYKENKLKLIEDTLFNLDTMSKEDRKNTGNVIASNSKK